MSSFKNISDFIFKVDVMLLHPTQKVNQVGEAVIYEEDSL